MACPFIGTPYGRQLEAKREGVREALSAHPALAGLEVPEVVPAPRSFGYRNQAKLVVRRARRGFLLGVYRPGSHQVVDICGCPNHQPVVNDVLACVRSAIERADPPVYDERDGTGWLRYVVVRASSWQKAAQVILVVKDRSWRGERDFCRRIARARGVKSVVLNLNETRGNVILGPDYVPLTREASLVDRVGDLRLKSRAGSFLQANVAASVRAYRRLVDWVAPEADDTVIDLYCGVGATSFLLATRAKLVWGVEESPPAVLDAKENIRMNGFHNVRFVAGGAAERLADLAAKLGRVDLVTLNPPRRGVDEAARAAIVACGPRRVGYMSCDPRSLARDLAWFAEHGYRTERLQPFDFLPQTDHVECVALLAAEAR